MASFLTYLKYPFVKTKELFINTVQSYLELCDLGDSMLNQSLYIKYKLEKKIELFKDLKKEEFNDEDIEKKKSELKKIEIQSGTDCYSQFYYYGKKIHFNYTVSFLSLLKGRVELLEDLIRKVNVIYCYENNIKFSNNNEVLTIDTFLDSLEHYKMKKNIPNIKKLLSDKVQEKEILSFINELFKLKNYEKGFSDTINEFFDTIKSFYFNENKNRDKKENFYFRIKFSYDNPNHMKIREEEYDRIFEIWQFYENQVEEYKKSNEPSYKIEQMKMLKNFSFRLFGNLNRVKYCLETEEYFYLDINKENANKALKVIKKKTKKKINELYYEISNNEFTKEGYKLYDILEWNDLDNIKNDERREIFNHYYSKLDITMKILKENNKCLNKGIFTEAFFKFQKEYIDQIDEKMHLMFGLQKFGCSERFNHALQLYTIDDLPS